jgi:hypothetical protein
MHFHASVFDNIQAHAVYGKRMEGKQGKMDVRAATFSQRELCQITGLDTVTVDTWLIRGILETTKVDGRVLRGRRLFSVLTIFEAKVTADLVNELAMGPSEASNVARCAGADWHAPDDWKRKVVEAIERSANVARVFLLVARADEGWVTIPSYANKNGPPRFEPTSKYEKWLARPLAVLPASDLLSFVYKKCEQIRNGSDDSGSRKKP